MLPEDVPDELVEQAERALAFGICKDNDLDGKCDCPTDEQIRHILAAVLPTHRETVRQEVVTDLKWLADARDEYGKPVTEETNAVRIVADMILAGRYEGWLPSWRWPEWVKRLNWLPSMTRCNCGYGGMHEPENPDCNLNKKG